MRNLRLFCAIALLCFGIAAMWSDESFAQVNKSQIVYTQFGEDGPVWIMNAEGSSQSFLLEREPTPKFSLIPSQE